MQNKALVVTSNYLPQKELTEAAIAILAKTGCGAETIEAEAITAKQDLSGYALVVYCVGSRYYEPSLPAFSQYVENGGNLVILSGNPFSEPYLIHEGRAELLKECTKGIRAFGFGDTFMKVDVHKQSVTLRLLRKEFGDKQEKADDICTAWAGLYHLSEQDESSNMVQKAKLLPIAAILDEEGHHLASPIIEIRTEQGGAFYGFLWENESGNILQSELAREIFYDVCTRSIAGNICIEAEMEYAFYYPTETPVLYLKDKYRNKGNDITCNVTVNRVQEMDGQECYRLTDFLIKNEKRLELPIKEEGQYKVAIETFSNGKWMDTVSTGFYLLADETVNKMVKDIVPVRIDSERATDFCVRGGQLYPILGTTYFVTDVYQKCFLHFNLDRCEQDLVRLKEDGFNTLRSGNWMLNVEFLGEEGLICERARRALYAYFLCACKYDFVVQFTLGCVALNDWDRSKCAIHNPDNMKKVLNLIDSFTKLYRIFPNVMLDVVNEPSYSFRGGWTLGMPSGDPYEKSAWRAWLIKKYKTVENLRAAWGEHAGKIPDFESISVPEHKSYMGTFYRTEEEREHTKIVDFYSFARESYSNWLHQIREVARENAPDMIVIMGRDESLRVPCEQDEVLQGNLDMVCWHQWNRNSLIFTEYMLNRVKGKITCAQEVGVYRVEKMRGGKILSDEQVANQLMRKILFGFGNWIQWQSYDNPDKAELSENMLGLYRADGSETKVMPALRRLIAAEKTGMGWMDQRQEDAFPIVTLYSTSSHFSAYGYNAIAQDALRSHIDILFGRLKNQSDMMLEHLFDRTYQSAIGKPALIILPGVMRLSQHCWEELLYQVEQGAVLLISGCVEEDEHFLRKERIGRLEEKELEYSGVRDYESIEINGERFLLDFRKNCEYAEVQNVLNKAVVAGEGAKITEYELGKGKVLYCPLPLELAADNNAAAALYRYAIDVANAQNKIYRVMTPKMCDNLEIHAIVYKSCTVYTIVNNGPKEELELLDLRSQTRLNVELAELGMGKIWIGADGQILNEYLSEGSLYSSKN